MTFNNHSYHPVIFFQGFYPIRQMNDTGTTHKKQTNQLVQPPDTGVSSTGNRSFGGNDRTSSKNVRSFSRTSPDVLRKTRAHFSKTNGRFGACIQIDREKRMIYSSGWVKKQVAPVTKK